MTTPARRRRYVRQRVDGGLYDVFPAVGGSRVGYVILDSDYRHGAWVHRWVGVALTFSGQREYLAPRDSLTAAIADVVAEAEKSPPTHPCRRLPLTVLVTDRETMEAVLASGRRTDSAGRPIHVTARRDMPGRWDIVDGHHRVAEALRRGETTARLSIRSCTHRGVQGFGVVGTDARGRRSSIFTETRGSAEVIKGRLQADQEIDLSDYFETDESISNPPKAHEPCPHPGCPGHLRFRNQSSRVGSAGELQLFGWMIVCEAENDRLWRHTLVSSEPTLDAVMRAYVQRRDEGGGWPADPYGMLTWLPALVNEGLEVCISRPTGDQQAQVVLRAERGFTKAGYYLTEGLPIDTGLQPTLAAALYVAYRTVMAPRCECGREMPPASNYAPGVPEWCDGDGACYRGYVSTGMTWQRKPESDRVPPYSDHTGHADMTTGGEIKVVVYSLAGHTLNRVETAFVYRSGKVLADGDGAYFELPERAPRRGRRQPPPKAIEPTDEILRRALDLAHNVVRGVRPEIMDPEPTAEALAATRQALLDLESQSGGRGESRRRPVAARS